MHDEKTCRAHNASLPPTNPHGRRGKKGARRDAWILRFALALFATVAIVALEDGFD
jgi:hypothetical protein